MGIEIKRDMCPPKYYSKVSLITDTLPVLIALVFVASVEASLLRAAGLDDAVILLVNIAFVALVYLYVFFMFRGLRSRLAETYISVCEYGVCGVYQKTGFKNDTFGLVYNEIAKMKVKKDRLLLDSPKGRVVLTLSDAANTGALIKMHSPWL